MQMQIGPFRFDVATGTEYAELKRHARRRWLARERFGQPPALEDRTSPGFTARMSARSSAARRTSPSETSKRWPRRWASRWRCCSEGSIPEAVRLPLLH